MANKWILSDSQLALVKTKKLSHRLFFALLLKYYEFYSQFFTHHSEVHWKAKSAIARQLSLTKKINKDLPYRTFKRYKNDIRNYFQSLGLTRENEICIKNWICEEILPKEEPNQNQLLEKTTAFMRKEKIEPLSSEYLKRIINSAKQQYERELFSKINAELSFETKAYLDGLLMLEEKVSRVNLIKNWPRGLSLKTILLEAKKLRFLNLLQLPSLEQVPNKRLQRYHRNICSQYPSSIKEMQEMNRYAMLTVFALVRQQQITDNLTDLLIRLIQKIVRRAENKLRTDLASALEIKKGLKNQEVLELLAMVILEHPDDIIREAIFPVVPKERLEKVLGKNNKKPTYIGLVHDRARNSYLHHYRRMLVPVLELLEFNSSNSKYKPIIEALMIIKEQLNSSSTYYPVEAQIPLEGAIKKSHKVLVLETTATGARVNRINYELCVLRNLREKLKTKEVWLSSGYKYRDPDKDLPQDFDVKRDYYYGSLKQGQDPKRFINKIKRKLQQSLKQLNSHLPKSKKVAILKKPAGYIRVAKLKEKEPLEQVEKIKQEIFKRWPSISLLDVLKETNRYTKFLKELSPSGVKEAIPAEILQKRLLLSILGCGTNAGLKSMSISNKDASYKDLIYVKRRYFDPDYLRNCIRTIVNELLKVRSTEIWKECTTAVASDSSHFQASDQNLISSWHARYHKKGVMIYWHVDTNSVCIYSQLKSCSSSEVASMIEGVLRHCTSMTVDKNYVDTHGASEIGFAFSYILDFDLLPRFKNLHSQKLYGIHPSDTTKYSNLNSIIVGAIKWELIERQYDQMIKYAVALKMGTADTEAILRRFTRKNSSHPTYKALSELGKAIKTIFLCRYLSSESLRQEIHEGLNVVERWNSVNDFIFYGKMGVMRGNRPEEFELSMLCLHLLQISLVYINTLMVQQILNESAQLQSLTIDEKRAITPLIYEHINPYGIFPLDLEKRIPINHPYYQEAEVA